MATKDGTKGKQLRFGHDDQGKVYAYWITLYIAQGRLFVFRRGPKRDMDASPTASTGCIDAKVRCNTFVSPVLASRTCNRW